MASYDSVAGNARRVQDAMADAALRSGRRPEEVELLAVTKFHPLEAVEAAHAAGLGLFGENRVQEAASKFEAWLPLHPEVRLDLIGSLQTNKAKKAVALFSTIESVDSLDLIRELQKRALAAGRRLGVLLELHTGEESKAGFPDREALARACELLAELGDTALVPRGLMTMAPFTDDPGLIRASFRKLRAAFDEIAATRAFPDFQVLSMGMTSDYEIAIEEGSTRVRVGTAIFGPRPGP
jgi:pyridoxal phosphate enzyme (YggS family)